jgi:hypothetical protein
MWEEAIINSGFSMYSKNAFHFNQNPNPPRIDPLTTSELSAIRPYINLVRTID